MTHTNTVTRDVSTKTINKKDRRKHTLSLANIHNIQNHKHSFFRDTSKSLYSWIYRCKLFKILINWNSRVNLFKYVFPSTFGIVNIWKFLWLLSVLAIFILLFKTLVSLLEILKFHCVKFGEFCAGPALQRIHFWQPKEIIDDFFLWTHDNQIFISRNDTYHQIITKSYHH